MVPVWVAQPKKMSCDGSASILPPPKLLRSGVQAMHRSLIYQLARQQNSLNTALTTFSLVDSS